MALYICPDCGHKVSSRIKACNNCGCPIEFVISAQTNKEDTETSHGADSSLVIENAQVAPIAAAEEAIEKDAVVELDVVYNKENGDFSQNNKGEDGLVDDVGANNTLESNMESDRTKDVGDVSVVDAEINDSEIRKINDDDKKKDSRLVIGIICGVIAIIGFILFVKFQKSDLEKYIESMNEDIANRNIEMVYCDCDIIELSYFDAAKASEVVDLFKGLRYLSENDDRGRNLQFKRNYVEYYDKMLCKDDFSSVRSQMASYSDVYQKYKNDIVEEWEAKKKMDAFVNKLKVRKNQYDIKILGNISNIQYNYLFFYGNLWHSEYEEYGDDIHACLYLYDANADIIKIYREKKGWVVCDYNELDKVKSEYNPSDTYRINVSDRFPTNSYLDNGFTHNVRTYLEILENNCVYVCIIDGIYSIDLSTLALKKLEASFLYGEKYAVVANLHYVKNKLVDNDYVHDNGYYTYSIMDLQNNTIVKNPFFNNGSVFFDVGGLHFDLKYDSEGTVYGDMSSIASGNSIKLQGSRTIDEYYHFFVVDPVEKEWSLFYYNIFKRENGQYVFQCFEQIENELYPKLLTESLAIKR